MPSTPFRSLVRVVSLTAIASFAFVAAAQQQSEMVDATAALRRVSPWWLQAKVERGSIYIDPATTERRQLLIDSLSLSVLSPDGKRIAYVESDLQRAKDGHESDLFIADVDPVAPSQRANMRRLTTNQMQPADPMWIASGDGIVFLAGEKPAQQVWYIDLAPGSKPVRLSTSERRCFQPSILADGRIAWLEHKGSKNKQQFIDLVLHPSPLDRGKMVTLLADQHISSYAFSPDGESLAWSGLGLMFIVNLKSGESREIPLNGIHRQLLNHSVYHFAWRPDGKVIAIKCGFLGGISRSMDGDPDAPWPRMFAADKVFFVPVAWKAAPEALEVGNEDFPSPMADDPPAETSPPAGDESKPWWLRELPDGILGIEWIAAEKVKDDC